MTDQKKTIEKKKRTWRKKVAKTATNSLSEQKKIKEAVAQRDARELETMAEIMKERRKRRKNLPQMRCHPEGGRRSIILCDDLEMIKGDIIKNESKIEEEIRKLIVKHANAAMNKTEADKVLEGIAALKSQYPTEYINVINKWNGVDKNTEMTEKELREIVIAKNKEFIKSVEDHKKANQCCFKRFWNWIWGVI